MAVAASLVSALAVAVGPPPTAPSAAAAAPVAEQAPGTVRFAVIGDYGTNDAGAAAVADLVDAAAPDFIATVGDNSCFGNLPDTAVGRYYADYIGAYNGVHGAGSTVNRFFPSLGNHDFTDGGGLPAYLDFFALPGAGITQLNPSGNERYYDFVQGPVRFFMVDSFGGEPDGNTAGSRQATWLRQGLAASTSHWNVVMFHHAPYTSWSLRPGNKEALQWPFEAWGADLVLTGHVHTYERIVRDDNRDGVPLTYVVNGLGGQTPHQFAATPMGGSQVRYNSRFGAQFIDATATTLTASFRTVDGVTRDRFTLSDADPRPDARIRRGPTGVLKGDGTYNTTGAGQAVGGTATAATPQQYHLSVQNDAPFPEVLRVRGTAGNATYNVRYWAGGVDVTTAVTAGAHVTPALAPGTAHTVLAVVTPRSASRTSSSLAAKLVARSTTDPAIRDTVTFLTLRG